jgi:hypothetical protein
MTLDPSMLDDEDQMRMGIARPSMADAVPSAAVRALPAPTPTATPAAAAPPAAGSTEDLESKALASHVTPRIAGPDAQPGPRGLRPKPGDFQPEEMPLWEKILSPIAIGAASYKNPQVGEKLMDQFYEAPKREAQQRYETASTAYEKQAEDERKQAELDKAKTGLTPEETTIHDLMTGENGQPRLNPETQKPFTYLEAYQAMKQTGQDVKPTKPDTPEQQFIDDYQKKNKGASIADAVKAYTLATTRPEKAGATDARADRSYTYNNNKLDTLAKPIEDAEARMSRLRESLAQNSPQADATIAPELLTIMAGGAGSGLRMNEAEISRVVGGRSKWQSLEASINQWSLDPAKANSITPDQRKQIRDLTEAVNAKLQQKQQALDDARQKLLDSDDPKEHRKIVTDAHHSLTQVDQAPPGGGNQPAAPKAGTVEGGYKFKGGNPADQKNWEKVPDKAQ